MSTEKSKILNLLFFFDVNKENVESGKLNNDGA